MNVKRLWGVVLLHTKANNSLEWVINRMGQYIGLQVIFISQISVIRKMKLSDVSDWVTIVVQRNW